MTITIIEREFHCGIKICGCGCESSVIEMKKLFLIFVQRKGGIFFHIQILA